MKLNTFVRHVCVSAVALTCSACATAPEPKVRTVEVRIPIREACVPADLPAKPETYADERLDAGTPPETRYLAVATANQQRRARLARIEPVIAGCR